MEFKCPGNWTAKDLGYLHAILNSPGNAVFSIFGEQEETAGDLASFVKEYDKDMQEGMPPFLTIETEIPGTGSSEDSSLSANFTISVMGTPVPHWRKFHRVKRGGKVFFFVAQVPMENLSKVKPGFDLILKTLTQG